MGADAHPAGLQRCAQAGLELDEARRGVLVLDRRELTALDDAEVRARSHRHHGALADDRRSLRAHARDRA
jgi:hypothetical protein